MTVPNRRVEACAHRFSDEMKIVVYAAGFLLFGLVFPFRMSANSTQRLTTASSFPASCFGGLTEPGKESTEGGSRFVGDGKGRQITTCFSDETWRSRVMDAD